MNPKYTLIALNSTSSTNDDAKGIIISHKDSSNHSLPCVITAKEQTAGRGRHGRIWQSLDGNLYMSVVMPITCALSNAAELSFIMGLAVYDVLKSLSEAMNISLKWPNDVYIDDKKIGGILLESFPQIDDKCIVIGVGINVHDAPADLPATSLRAHNIDISTNNLLDIIMARFYHYHNIWKSDGFSKIRKIWIDRAYKIGQIVTVNNITGIFESIDETGAMLIKESSFGTSHTISTAEIL